LDSSKQRGDLIPTAVFRSNVLQQREFVERYSMQCGLTIGHRDHFDRLLAELRWSRTR